MNEKQPPLQFAKNKYMGSDGTVYDTTPKPLIDARSKPFAILLLCQTICFAIFGVAWLTGCVETKPTGYSTSHTTIGHQQYITEVTRGNKKYIIYSAPNGVCKLDEEYLEKPVLRPEGLLND